MRKLSYALAASLLALGLAGQAQAVQLGFVGDISVQVATLDPLALTGAGSATVNGSTSGGHVNTLDIAGGTFAVASLVVPVTDPGADAPPARFRRRLFTPETRNGFDDRFGIHDGTSVSMKGP